MKKIILASFAIFFCFVSCSQEKKKLEYDKKKQVYTVEAACGTCMFKMQGKGCPLAIRMNGKSYYVEGTSLDDHGDAHGEDGFCNAIRKAQVQGKVEGDKFVVTYFKLLKVD